MSSELKSSATAVLAITLIVAIMVAKLGYSYPASLIGQTVGAAFVLFFLCIGALILIVVPKQPDLPGPLYLYTNVPWAAIPATFNSVGGGVAALTLAFANEVPPKEALVMCLVVVFVLAGTQFAALHAQYSD